MFKNAKVILVGGSPMTGKTTLATIMSACYGYSQISTDTIGDVLQGAINCNPMNGWDYREYFIKNPIYTILEETAQYHKALFPSIKRLIDIHSDWEVPMIIEGGALYPQALRYTSSEKVKKLWLISDEEILRSRFEINYSLYNGASDIEMMKTNYLKRCIWHNDKIKAECRDTGDTFLEIKMDMNVESVFEKVLEIWD